MSAIGRILCPVDVLRPSSAAVRCAFVMADWFHATIDALHVASGDVSSAFSSRVERLGEPPATEDARRQLEQIVGQGASSVSRTLEAAEGAALQVILDRVKVHRSDLIVLGTRADQRTSFRSAQGLADGLATETECPVLTVPENLPDAFVKHILLPVDFSNATDAAVRWAGVIASRFDARVDVLHALTPARPEDAGMRASASSLAGIAGAVKRLQGIEDRLRAAGVRATSNVLVEAPTLQAVLALSERGSYELVILGMHERNPYRIGPGAATVATLRRRVTVPVLSVLTSRPALLFMDGSSPSQPSDRKLELAC